jgi:predicted DNA-binding protein
MHTTTVRFDEETWTRLKRLSEELGIATADYIRGATIQRLERTAYDARIRTLEDRVDGMARLLERLRRRFGIR